MRLGSATIIFQDRKVFSLLKIFDRFAFDVVPAVVEMTRIVAEIVEHFQQPFIFFVCKAHQLTSTAQVKGTRKIKNLSLRNDVVQLVSVLRFQFLLPESRSVVSVYQFEQCGNAIAGYS